MIKLKGLHTFMPKSIIPILHRHCSVHPFFDTPDCIVHSGRDKNCSDIHESSTEFSENFKRALCALHASDSQRSLIGRLALLLFSHSPRSLGLARSIVLLAVRGLSTICVRSPCASRMESDAKRNGKKYIEQEVGQ